MRFVLCLTVLTLFVDNKFAIFVRKSKFHRHGKNLSVCVSAKMFSGICNESTGDDAVS